MMSTGEIVISVIASLFAIAFGLWARRLDKALDMLDEIRKELTESMREIEHRITDLEAFKKYCMAQLDKISYHGH